MNVTIQQDEKLYRYVKSTNPDLWKAEEGKPSSALFKDSKGVSVDRDDNRSDQEIISTFENRFGAKNMKALVYLDAGTCMDIPTYLKYAPEADNPYHAEIHDTEDNAQLSGSKAKRLARAAQVVYLKD